MNNTHTEEMLETQTKKTQQSKPNGVNSGSFTEIHKGVISPCTIFIKWSSLQNRNDIRYQALYHFVILVMYRGNAYVSIRKLLRHYAWIIALEMIIT